MIHFSQMHSSKSNVGRLANSLWLKSFILVLSINMFLFIFSPIYYTVADDYLLNYIANGSFGSEYSNQLVFISPLIGNALSFLYHAYSSLNWYALILETLIVCSFTVVVHEIYLQLNSKLILFVLMLLNIIYVESLFSFTSVAFLAELSGFILLASYGLRTRNSRGECLVLLFGAFLVIVGYCLREETLLPTAILVIPPMLIITFQKERDRLKEIRSAITRPSRLLPLLTCAGLIIVVLQVYQSQFSSPDWESFYRFTNARSNVLDYPAFDYKNNQEVIRSLGFTDNDCAMLYNWVFAERDIFTVERLHDLSNLAINSYSLHERLLSGMKRLQLLWPYLSICPIGVFIIFRLTRKEYNSVAAISEILILATMILFLAFIRMRLMLRVAAPLITISFIVLSLCGTAKIRNGWPRKLLKFSYAIICGAFILSQFYPQMSLNNRPDSESCVYEALRYEVTTHKDILYVVHSGIVNEAFFAHMPVQDITYTDVFSNVVRAGSWDTFSPRYYNQVAPFAIDPNNLLTSTIQDNVRYVDYDDQQMVAFIRDHSNYKGVDCQT